MEKQRLIAAALVLGLSGGLGLPARGAELFGDVPASHWAADSIGRAVELGVVDGYGDGSFRPERPVTRAEFVTMLWKLAGKPEAEPAADFIDVPADSWYGPQIGWARETGLVDGVSRSEFDPEGPITREQAMTILFRQAGGVSGMEGMFTATYDQYYTDSDTISAWARPAMYWGVFQTLINGVTEHMLAPRAPASRAQTVAILLRNDDRT